MNCGCLFIASENPFARIPHLIAPTHRIEIFISVNYACLNRLVPSILLTVFRSITSVKQKTDASVHEVYYCTEMQFSLVVRQRIKELDVRHSFLQFCTAVYAVYLKFKSFADQSFIWQSLLNVRQLIQQHSRSVVNKISFQCVLAIQMKVLCLRVASLSP